MEDETQLVSGLWLAWLPDGAEIAFVADEAFALVAMEKAVLRNNLNVEMQEKIKKLTETRKGGAPQVITQDQQEAFKELQSPY